MEKKQKYQLLLFCFLSVSLMLGIGKCMGREACAKNVCGWWTVYTYYDRKLSASDFAQFDYDMTYEEITEKLGEPNGWVCNSSSCLPYYELDDGRFAVCGYDLKKYIYIANDKDMEYYLLPPRLKQKSEALKKREVENAKQSEMNIVLWMLGMRDLKQYMDDWEKPEQDDEPLGEFSAEQLKQYTDREIAMEAFYYLGAYHDSDLYPLIQVVWLYEEQTPICFGYVLWDTDMLRRYMFREDDAKYVEHADDWVLQAEKYALKGRTEFLDSDRKNMDLTAINLSPDKITNSIAEFLVKEKVAGDRRRIRVEFWGEDGDGNYVCAFMTSLWNKGRDIHADGIGTKYYVMTLETLDNRVGAVKGMLLERDCSE